MKKVGLLLIALSLTLSGYSQGFLSWGNQFSGFRAAIFGPESNLVQLSGQTSQFFGGTTSGFQDSPLGTQTYTGLLLSGTKYTFAAFAGSMSSPSSSLSLLGQTSFRTSTSTGNVFPKGLVFGATASVPGVSAGEQAYYQIRVWDNQNGTLTSWALAEAAWLNGTTLVGVSPLLVSGILGGIDPGGNIIPTPMTDGITSFNLSIPEPSLFALAGVGAATLLVTRLHRKKP